LARSLGGAPGPAGAPHGGGPPPRDGCGCFLSVSRSRGGAQGGRGLNRPLLCRKPPRFGGVGGAVPRQRGPAGGGQALGLGRAWGSTAIFRGAVGPGGRTLGPVPPLGEAQTAPTGGARLRARGLGGGGGGGAARGRQPPWGGRVVCAGGGGGGTRRGWWGAFIASTRKQLNLFEWFGGRGGVRGGAWRVVCCYGGIGVLKTRNGGGLIHRRFAPPKRIHRWPRSSGVTGHSYDRGGKNQSRRFREKARGEALSAA